MAEDKFGQTLSSGDTVEFVFGGDAFQAPIEGTAEMNGRTWVQATITVFIPDTACALVEQAQPAKKSTPKADAGAAAAEAPPPSQETEPDPAPKSSSTKGKK